MIRYKRSTYESKEKNKFQRINTKPNFTLRFISFLFFHALIFNKIFLFRLLTRHNVDTSQCWHVTMLTVTKLSTVLTTSKKVK